MKGSQRAKRHGALSQAPGLSTRRPATKPGSRKKIVRSKRPGVSEILSRLSALQSEVAFPEWRIQNIVSPLKGCGLMRGGSRLATNFHELDRLARALHDWIKESAIVRQFKTELTREMVLLEKTYASVNALLEREERQKRREASRELSMEVDNLCRDIQARAWALRNLRLLMLSTDDSSMLAEIMSFFRRSRRTEVTARLALLGGSFRFPTQERVDLQPTVKYQPPDPKWRW